jgi:hypothetical protein
MKLENRHSQWDTSTMTVVADEQMRVALPAVQPGDSFDLQIAGDGKFMLTRLDPKAAADLNERRRNARIELVALLENSGAVIGEKPSRDRTYSDRRFHRH